MECKREAFDHLTSALTNIKNQNEEVVRFAKQRKLHGRVATAKARFSMPTSVAPAVEASEAITINDDFTTNIISNDETATLVNVVVTNTALENVRNRAAERGG
jgi:hypothetical protein